jgi:hypothetical protein
VSYDQSDYGVWGRNLSENKLRSFNWQAECVCFARMKVEGKDENEIGKIFGIDGERSIGLRIALGNIPTLTKLQDGTRFTVPSHTKLEGETRFTLTFRDAVHFLLPLRIEKGRNPDNGNERIYDYSEVTTCISKLISTDPKIRLSKDDLPSYSADRRVAIKEAQQDARLKEIAAQEVAAWQQRRNHYKRNAIPKAQNILSTIDRLPPSEVSYHRYSYESRYMTFLAWLQGPFSPGVFFDRHPSHVSRTRRLGPLRYRLTVWGESSEGRSGPLRFPQVHLGRPSYTKHSEPVKIVMWVVY